MARIKVDKKLIAAGLGTAGLLLLLTRKAKAAPPPETPPPEKVTLSVVVKNEPSGSFSWASGDRRDSFYTLSETKGISEMTFLSVGAGGSHRLFIVIWDSAGSQVFPPGGIIPKEYLLPYSPVEGKAYTYDCEKIALE